MRGSNLSAADRDRKRKALLAQIKLRGWVNEDSAARIAGLRAFDFNRGKHHKRSAQSKRFLKAMEDDGLIRFEAERFGSEQCARRIYLVESHQIERSAINEVLS